MILLYGAWGGYPAILVMLAATTGVAVLAAGRVLRGPAAAGPQRD